MGSVEEKHVLVPAMLKVGVSVPSGTPSEIVVSQVFDHLLDSASELDVDLGGFKGRLMINTPQVMEVGHEC